MGQQRMGRGQFKGKKFKKQEIIKSENYMGNVQQDLLSDPDSSWSFSREYGLTLSDPKISDSGYYQCVGTVNDVPNHENFRIIVKGKNE
jgi:hypothetical protein